MPEAGNSYIERPGAVVAIEGEACIRLSSKG